MQCLDIASYSSSCLSPFPLCYYCSFYSLTMRQGLSGHGHTSPILSALLALVFSVFFSTLQHNTQCKLSFITFGVSWEWLDSVGGRGHCYTIQRNCNTVSIATEKPMTVISIYGNGWPLWCIMDLRWAWHVTVNGLLRYGPAMLHLTTQGRPKPSNQERWRAPSEGSNPAAKTLKGEDGEIQAIPPASQQKKHPLSGAREAQEAGKRESQEEERQERRYNFIMVYYLN